jgi:HK97 family phage prohead protease
MTVRGYATTFNQPYTLWKEDGFTVREQIDPAAFDECDMSDVIMQYNHEGRVFARTSNGTLSIGIDEKGLPIEARLDGTELGREVYEEIVGGYTTKMSFGFKVGEDRRELTENRETGEVDVLRTITKITKLYDVSAVSIPANDATSISARSYGEGVIAEITEEIREREKRERQKQKIRILTEVLK